MCRLRFPPEPHRWVLRPKLGESSPTLRWWYWCSTTKNAVSSVPHMAPHVLDICPASPWSRRWHNPLYHVYSSMYVPSVSHYIWSSSFSSPSIKAQRSSSATPSPSARAPRDLYLCHRLLSPYSTPTSQHIWLQIQAPILWLVQDLHHNTIQVGNHSSSIWTTRDMSILVFADIYRILDCCSLFSPDIKYHFEQ